MWTRPVWRRLRGEMSVCARGLVSPRHRTVSVSSRLERKTLWQRYEPAVTDAVELWQHLVEEVWIKENFYCLDKTLWLIAPKVYFTLCLTHFFSWYCYSDSPTCNSACCWGSVIPSLSLLLFMRFLFFIILMLFRFALCFILIAQNYKFATEGKKTPTYTSFWSCGPGVRAGRLLRTETWSTQVCESKWQRAGGDKRKSSQGRCRANQSVSMRAVVEECVLLCLLHKKGREK